jgi:hypothetical protein
MADGNSILPSILLGAEYLSEQPADGKLNNRITGNCPPLPPVDPSNARIGDEKGGIKELEMKAGGALNKSFCPLVG